MEIFTDKQTRQITKLDKTMSNSQADLRSEKAAKEFEAIFIAQILQYSGLAKALTANGGQAVESFTHFYLQELAKDITEQGGFGLARQISAYIDKKEESNGELGKV